MVGLRGDEPSGRRGYGLGHFDGLRVGPLGFQGGELLVSPEQSAKEALSSPTSESPFLLRGLGLPKP